MCTKMNNQLINKIIKTNDTTGGPELLYENPLIDRSVAGALARSFVKILHISQQDCKLNTNLRHSVLANIRKLCRIESENHMEVDENFTKSLSELYLDELKSSTCSDPLSGIERSLDEFLAKKMLDGDVSFNRQCSVNVEVFQSLLNLNSSQSFLEPISKNILYWDVSTEKQRALVKRLSNTSVNTNICTLSIKMKSEIEHLLLNLCCRVLTELNLSVDELFAKDKSLQDLIMKCSISTTCYQICYGVLNHIFVHTKYNTDILMFVSKFVQNVNTNCTNGVSVLYPVHLSFIVLLLDINLDALQGVVKEKYIRRTCAQLKMCHEKSEADLILLLSHFPAWFQVYCV